MPLKPGAPVSDTIKELYHNGSRPRSRDQIIAIAEANHSRAHSEGGLVGYASGGATATPGLNDPNYPVVNIDTTPSASPGLGGAAPQSQGIPYALQLAAYQEAAKAQQLPQLPPSGQPAGAITPYGATGPAQSQMPGAGGMAKGGIMGTLNAKPPRSLSRITEPVARGGFLHSPISGRTDSLATRVRSGSHIIPADVVSSLGQGNSLAGAQNLDRVMRALPQPAFASGGNVHQGHPHHRLGNEHDETSPVLLAGGEYIVEPEEVTRWGSGDHKKGHDLIDKMIVNVRNKEAKRMLKLPGPKK